MAEDSRGLFDSLTAFASTLVSIAHTLSLIHILAFRADIAHLVSPESQD